MFHYYSLVPTTSMKYLTPFVSIVDPPARLAWAPAMITAALPVVPYFIPLFYSLPITYKGKANPIVTRSVCNYSYSHLKYSMKRMSSSCFSNHNKSTRRNIYFVPRATVPPPPPASHHFGQHCSLSHPETGDEGTLSPY